MLSILDVVLFLHNDTVKKVLLLPYFIAEEVSE